VAAPGIRSLRCRAQETANCRKITRAAHHFDRALVSWPNSPLLWSNRGQVLRSLGRYEEELAAIDRSLALEPNDRILLRKALALCRLARSGEAVEIYRGVIERNPDHPDAYFALATVQSTGDSPDYDAILKLTRRVTEIDPKYVTALDLHGWALCRVKRYAEAEVELRRAMALGSQARRTLRSLGLSLYHLRKFSESLELFDQLLTLDNRDFSGLQGRFISLLALGRRTECERMLEELADGGPDPAAWIRNARWFSYLGRPAEARISCEKALQLDSNNVAALELSRELKG
jgi:tetratricopeptide (TPR) repeat protein